MNIADVQVVRNLMAHNLNHYKQTLANSTVVLWSWAQECIDVAREEDKKLAAMQDEALECIEWVKNRPERSTIA